MIVIRGQFQPIAFPSRAYLGKMLLQCRPDIVNIGPAWKQPSAKIMFYLVSKKGYARLINFSLLVVYFSSLEGIGFTSNRELYLYILSEIQCVSLHKPRM